MVTRSISFNSRISLILSRWGISDELFFVAHVENALFSSSLIRFRVFVQMISKKDLLLTSEQHTLVFLFLSTCSVLVHCFFRLNNNYFAMYFSFKTQIKACSVFLHYRIKMLDIIGYFHFIRTSSFASWLYWIEFIFLHTHPKSDLLFEIFSGVMVDGIDVLRILRVPYFCFWVIF